MDSTAAAPVREERPRPRLMAYYALRSLVLGPFFFFLLIPSFLRYRTLVYRFDDEGISMRWGALFRREVHLTYARIQDIHLTSNLVERWLGLGRVEVQTASGSSKAEMVIEGLPDFEAIRDLLYRRMHGGDDGTGALAGASGTASRAVPRPAGAGLPGATPVRHEGSGVAPIEAAGGLDPQATHDLALVLDRVTLELKQIRLALGQRRTEGAEPPAVQPEADDGRSGADR